MDDENDVYVWRLLAAAVAGGAIGFVLIMTYNWLVLP